MFSLNDVATLEHTRYLGMLKYIGALGREGSEKRGGPGHGGEGKAASSSRERIIGRVSVSGRGPAHLSLSAVSARQWLADALKENDPASVLLFLVGSKKDLSVSVPVVGLPSVVREPSRI